jgi:hypothetical protein
MRTRRGTQALGLLEVMSFNAARWLSLEAAEDVLGVLVVCCRLLSGCSSLWKCQSLDAESRAIYLEDCAAITTI